MDEIAELRVNRSIMFFQFSVVNSNYISTFKILSSLLCPQHMLMSFRVSELQSLLGFAGRSKSGRKHELMGRALQMLKGEGSHNVKKKLRELYERRCGPRKVVVPTQPRTAIQPRTVIPQQQPSQQPRPAINSDTTGVPVHPDVRLSHLPFFEHIDDLVRPTSLGE